MTNLDLLKEFMRDPIVQEHNLLNEENVELLNLHEKSVPIVELFKTVITAVKNNEEANKVVRKISNFK